MNVRIFILIWALAGFSLLGLAQGPSAPYRLTLPDALRKANTINLQVMMADARVEQAIARISQAQSDLLPHLDGDVNGGRQTSDLRAEGIQFPGLPPEVGPYNSFDARVRVSMAFIDLAAIERFQAAKKGADLSQAALQKTREDVLALTASLFVDARRKQENVKLFQVLLDRDRMAYELSQEGLAQGTGILLDSNKSNADLSQTQYLFEQAQRQALEARLDLEAALQIPLDRPVEFLDDDDFLKTLEKNTGIDSNHAINADMALAASQLEARKADQKAARADFLPTVSGAANYGRLGESPVRGSNTYFVGVQANIPIWEGGETQAKLKEIKGQVKEAALNLQDSSQQEQVDITKARAAIGEAYDLREAKIQKRRTAQQALRIAVHAQEIGSGTVLELMQSKADLAVAEDEYNEAQATWVIAHIDLLHAQGRLRDLIKKGE